MKAKKNKCLSLVCNRYWFDRIKNGQRYDYRHNTKYYNVTKKITSYGNGDIVKFYIPFSNEKPLVFTIQSVIYNQDKNIFLIFFK